MLEKWTDKPIFISSTFNDMHFERDYLKDVVFPNIEREMIRHNISIIPVDLRGGVILQEERKEELVEHQVLKMCLSEIDRSNPFLIVLLGDRYGWIPPEEIMTDYKEREFLSFDTNELSVTAFEINYALQQKQFENVFFYIREDLDYNDMDAKTRAKYNDVYATDHEAIRRTKLLQKLKEEVYQYVPKDRVKTYQVKWDRYTKSITNLSEFGKIVEKDLLETILKNVQLPLEKIDWDKMDDQLEQTVILHHSHQFIEHPCLPLKFLENYCQEEYDKKTVVLVGESGIGKTALFSWVASKLMSNGALMLSYQVNLRPYSTKRDMSEKQTIINRWIYELDREIGDSIDEQSIEAYFFDKIQEILTKQPIFILIDDSHNLMNSTWEFIENISKLGARVLLTKRADTGGKYILNANYINLKPIETELSSLILEQLRIRYGRHLTETHIRQIFEFEREDLKNENKNLLEVKNMKLDDSIHWSVRELVNSIQLISNTKSVGNPLWLKLAFHHVLLINERDFTQMQRFTGEEQSRVIQLIQERVQEFPPTVEGMYKLFIQAMEKRINPEMVQFALSVLHEFPEYMTEQHVFGFVQANFGSSNATVDEYIMFKSIYQHYFTIGMGKESWQLERREAKEAVKKRYLMEPYKRAQLILKGIQYMEQLSENSRFKMMHLLKAKRSYIQLLYREQIRIKEKSLDIREDSLRIKELKEIRNVLLSFLINGFMETNMTISECKDVLLTLYNQYKKSLEIYQIINPLLVDKFVETLQINSEKSLEIAQVKDALNLAKGVYDFGMITSLANTFNVIADSFGDEAQYWNEQRHYNELFLEIYNIWDKILKGTNI